MILAYLSTADRVGSILLGVGAVATAVSGLRSIERDRRREIEEARRADVIARPVPTHVAIRPRLYDWAREEGRDRDPGPHGRNRRTPGL